MIGIEAWTHNVTDMSLIGTAYSCEHTRFQAFHFHTRCRFNRIKAQRSCLTLEGAVLVSKRIQGPTAT